MGALIFAAERTKFLCYPGIFASLTPDVHLHVKDDAGTLGVHSVTRFYRAMIHYKEKETEYRKTWLKISRNCIVRLDAAP